MLAVFPLTTARDKRWWNHCFSLGSPGISTSIFARQLKSRAGLVIHTSVFGCNWLKVIIVPHQSLFRLEEKAASVKLWVQRRHCVEAGVLFSFRRRTFVQ